MRGSIKQRMSDDWILIPEAVFDGNTLQAGAALHIAGDRIAAVGPADTLPDLPRHGTPLIAAPGYVDLQVNGGGGVQLNNDPTAAAMLAIAAAHRQTGTVAILPTLITDIPEKMQAAADAIRQVCGTGGVAGIHLEGPHLSLRRRGTHKAEFIRPLDDHTMTIATGLAHDGIPVMLTLAPEMAQPGAIRDLVAAGVVVSLGHTAADAAQTRAAIAEGAQSATHLYNAMEQMTSRIPGALGTIIDSDLTAGIIADGYHVDFAMIRLAFRARPAQGRMVLVSDAMATVHGPDAFSLYGETIRVVDGRLVNAEGALAGVHIDMAESVENLVARAGLPLDQVLAAATGVPARLMGLPDGIGRIAPGAAADLVLIDRQGRLCAQIAEGHWPPSLRDAPPNI